MTIYDPSEPSLTVAQYRALNGGPVPGSAKAAIVDINSHLITLTVSELAAMAGQGIDRLDATGDVLWLTVAQYLALPDAVQLSPEDVVTLRDTGAALAELSAAAVGGLAARGVSALDAIDNVLAISVAQLQALSSVTLTHSDVATLADSAGALGSLTVDDLSVLAGKGIDFLHATGGVLAIDVAHYLALGTAKFVADDQVTLADTGEALATLAPRDIKALAGNGVDRIDVTDGTLALSVAQYRALGAVALTAANDVILLDTGRNLGRLTPEEISGLAGRGIDRLDAIDDALSFGIEQYLALGSVALTSGDLVTLADTGAALGGLTVGAISDLFAKGIDSIGPTDNFLSLTLAQYDALGPVGLTGNHTVTLADTSAVLAAQSASKLTAISAKGIDVLDATNDVLLLTVEQYRAMGGLTLADGDLTTLRDTNANLATLSPSEIAGLAGKRFDRLRAIDGVVSLTAAQFQALGPVVMIGNDAVTVADTGASLAAIPAASFGTMAKKKVDAIHATDGVLPLSVAQYLKLGTVALTAADTVTLADTGANLAGLSSSQIGGLAGKGIDRLDAIDGVLSLTRAQYLALGAVTLAAADVVTLADTGSRLALFTASDLPALAAAGIDRLDATNNVLSLTVAQYRALGAIALSQADVVTLADTGASLATLTAGEIGALAGKGVDKLDATDGTLSLTVAQYRALGAVALISSDSVTLSDSGEALASLTPTEIAALAGAGIDRIDATDDQLSLSLAQFSALGTVLLTGSDALTLAGTAGKDNFGFSRQTLGTTDRVDGGAGSDTLTLSGDYSAQLPFDPATIANIEAITLGAGNSYSLRLADGNVAAGQTLTINATRLGSADSATIDGHAETDGHFVFNGSAGSSKFTGGNGADQINAGSGADLVRYTAAAQSTSTHYDTVNGFDAAHDRFQVWTGVAGVDAPVMTGSLSTASFDADLATAMTGLAPHHAVLFAPDAGTLAGTQFLVVDTDGAAGYQDGDDLVVRLTGATGLGAFAMGNFAFADVNIVDVTGDVLLPATPSGTVVDHAIFNIDGGNLLADNTVVGGTTSLIFGPDTLIHHVGHFGSVDGIGNGGVVFLTNQGQIIADYDGGSPGTAAGGLMPVSPGPYVYYDDAGVFHQLGTFVNQGGITVTNGDTVYMYTLSANYGTISVDGGSMILIAGSPAGHIGPYIDSFVNEAGGLIAASEGSTVFLGAKNWSNAGTITVASSAGLHLMGTVTTAGLGNIVNTGGAEIFTGTLDNSGSILKVGSGTALGTTVVADEGTSLMPQIVGGTIVDSGGGMQFHGGHLVGVTYQGVLDLSMPNQALSIDDGLTVTGADGTGPGVVDLRGTNSILKFAGTQTFDDATIHVGGGSSGGGASQLNADALTLGPDVTVEHDGAYSVSLGGGTIDNQGTIHVDRSDGGLFAIGSDSFINEGTIVASNGDVLSIGGGTAVENAGTVESDTGSSVTVNGLLSNDGGTIKSDGGSVTLNGSVTNTGQLWATDGGSLQVNGAVTGTGTALISGASYLGFGQISSADTTFDAGSTGLLELGDSLNFSGLVAGFSTATSLGLQDIAYGDLTTATFVENDSNTGGILTVTDGIHTSFLNLAGQYTDDFKTDSGGTYGGTLVTYHPFV